MNDWIQLLLDCYVGKGIDILKKENEIVFPGRVLLLVSVCLPLVDT